MITLKEHNRKPYDELCMVLEENNRCAYIAATGTGKSYVTGKYVDEYCNADRTLILVPTNPIKNGWKDLLPKATVMTYQAVLMGKEIPHDIETIICDEMHHLGATEWGRIYDTHIRNFSGKVIGTTATPIRFMDHGRDMVDECFDGVSVEGLDLPAAISAGVLPSFEYITALYNLPSYIPDKGYRNECTEHLFKQLDFMNSKYSFRNILLKHLEPEGHKVAVFVNAVDEIDTVKGFCQELYPDAAHFVIHSYKGKKGNEKAISEFKNCDGMSFIYTVNMLNEGVHIDGVDVIVMFRKTESPAIYLQQLGRGLSSKTPDKRVKIFDFVANYRNLKQDTASVAVMNWITDGISNPERQVVIRDYALEELEVLNRISEIITKRWTPEEDSLLKEHYSHGKGMPRLLSLMPGRTEKAISARAALLGLTDKRDWKSCGAYDAVTELYGVKDGKRIFEERFPEAPPRTFDYIAIRLGLKETNKELKWSESENEQLVKLLEQGKTCEEISAVMGRSKKAVRYHRKKLGLAEPTFHWSEESDKILLENKQLSSPEIQRKFLPKVGLTTINRRRRELNLTRESFWTEKKEELFEELYRSGGAKKVLNNAEFADLTLNVVRKHAHKNNIKAFSSAVDGGD